MAEALFGSSPAFARGFTVSEGGDLQAQIPAPRGSNVHRLRVCTANGEDTWIQFGIANAFYPVDTARELVRILSGLLSDRLKFVIISKRAKWTGTTLTLNPRRISLQRSECAQIYSWSGKHDQTLGFALPEARRKAGTRGGRESPSTSISPLRA